MGVNSGKYGLKCLGCGSLGVEILLWSYCSGGFSQRLSWKLQQCLLREPDSHGAIISTIIIAMLITVIITMMTVIIVTVMTTSTIDIVTLQHKLAFQTALCLRGHYKVRMVCVGNVPLNPWSSAQWTLNSVKGSHVAII